VERGPGPRLPKPGLREWFAFGLRLAADLLGTSLPASVDRWTTVDPAAVSLTFGIRQRYDVDRGGSLTCSSGLAFTSQPVTLAGQAPLRLASGVVPNSLDRAILPLHRGLLFSVRSQAGATRRNVWNAPRAGVGAPRTTSLSFRRVSG